MQIMKENENVKQLAEALTNIEALSHKKKGQEIEVNTLRRQLSSAASENMIKYVLCISLIMFSWFCREPLRMLKL